MSDETDSEVPAQDDGGELSLSRAEVIQQARDIAESYFAQGLRLTVRQLYYQFVARGLLGSGQKVYKKIVAALADARLEGRFPMHLIEDRGRDAKSGDFTLCEDDPERALDQSASTIGRLAEIYLRYDRWYGQETFVSVWVEKEALAGVFEAPCEELGVGLFACKGYPSVSALYQWLKHFEAAVQVGGEEAAEGDDGQRRLGTAQKAVILYFGDHDPDGIEIPKSCLRTLETLRFSRDYYTDEPRCPKLYDETGVTIELQRVALNMAQVRQYKPPPFDAKITSSRFAAYQRAYGTDAWELDALDPAVLQRLIHESVARHWDPDVYEANRQEIRRRRKKLKEAMLTDGWFKKALAGSA